MGDSFESFVDLDWAGAENDNSVTSPPSNTELDLEMSSDLFKYFLESEIANSPATSTHLEYPSLVQDPSDVLPILPTLVAPSALMSNTAVTTDSPTTVSLETLSNLPQPPPTPSQTPSLPNSPATSHHPDEDVTMAEVKSEPVLLTPTDLLRVLTAHNQLDGKAMSMEAAVAVLAASSQQQIAKPAQQAAKAPSRTQRASSMDSDDEPILITDPADLKKMTSKERRQLRNKISARNFRVRRKEYISTLEAQVQQHQDEANQLRERMTVLEEENRQLREEVEQLRRQPTQAVSPSSPTDTTMTATKSISRGTPPITKPNLNKDLSISGSRATDTYRQDQARILVSNAIMPEWNLERILAQEGSKPENENKSDIPTFPTTDLSLTDLTFVIDHPREAALVSAFVNCLTQRMVACFVESITAMSVEDTLRWLYPVATTPTLVESETDWDMPLKPDDLIFTPKPNNSAKPAALEDDNISFASLVDETPASAAYMEWLYDAMIMAALSSASPTAGVSTCEGEGQSVSGLDRFASFLWWEGAGSM
ncbi:hypothetical protein BC937DRAFT_87154 [Endogone sp. FLAS-F59071]|nr:hypothetical protein BC937DRAFT_87154 [Endogone sp. FLAS-F59071]|eukprot:RUS19653.1 hypothetical protein BC937DRAFT_87154 [Endogone sp. FLAS-F59071]